MKPRTITLASLAVISVAVFLPYYNALYNRFSYDDVPIIEHNPLIRYWHNIPDIFSQGYWTQTGLGSGGLYRPLTILSYLFEFQAVGLNPVIYHLDNILLHLLCCVLIYFIISRLTGDAVAATIAAVLFAVHPVHVEAVSNVVGRAELLAALFTLSGLYTFMDPPRRIPWYVISPALMFLGLLSKETTVVLPLIIIAYMFVYERDGRGRGLRSIAYAIAPYILVTAVYMLLRYIVIADELAPQGSEQVLAYTKGAWRFVVMTKVFFYYLRLSLFPTDLRLAYMVRPPDSLINPWTILFICLVLAFFAFSFRLLRNGRGYLFFGLWFIIALLPVSNIIPIGILMSERAMYLPSVALCAVAGFLFSSAAGWRDVSGRKRAYAVAALFLAAAVSMGALTRARNPVWMDGVSMNVARAYAYQRCADNFPETALFYGFLSEAYISLHRYDDALAALQKGAEAEPDALYIHIYLVRLHMKMKRPDLALAEVRKALSLSENQPNYVNALFAEVFYKNGLVDEAKVYAEKAIKADPGEYYQDIAEIAKNLWGAGMYDESERYIRLAIRLNPYVPTHHLYYAYLHFIRNEYDAALEEIDIAEKLDPTLPDPYFYRGLVFGTMGDYQSAVEQLEKAVGLTPDDPELHYYLAAAYHKSGREEMAVRELEEALRLDPGFEEARLALEGPP